MSKKWPGSGRTFTSLGKAGEATSSHSQGAARRNLCLSAAGGKPP